MPSYYDFAHGVKSGSARKKVCEVSLAAQIMESFEASIQRLIIVPGQKLKVTAPGDLAIGL